MTPPTLHRLLWGPNSKKDVSLADWHIRAWEVPAVGLPVRVAAYLFLAAQRAAVPSDWNPMQGPLTWRLEDEGDLLSAGRRLQFGFEDTESSTGGSSSKPQVRRSMIWEVEPHPAYYLPFVAEPSHGSLPAVLCSIARFCCCSRPWMGEKPFWIALPTTAWAQSRLKIAGIGDLVCICPWKRGEQ